jgi:hypothetical protein
VQGILLPLSAKSMFQSGFWILLVSYDLHTQTSAEALIGNSAMTPGIGCTCTLSSNEYSAAGFLQFISLCKWELSPNNMNDFHALGDGNLFSQTLTVMH